jgi:AraC-like DNA-binding protein
MESSPSAGGKPHAGSDPGLGIAVAGVPEPRLRGIVQRYVGYADRFSGVARQLEAPTGGVVLIVGLGPTLRVLDPRRCPDPAEHRGGFVAGLHDGPVTTEATGEIRVVQANLTPIGARWLLRVPMDALTNRTVDLEDLLGEAGRVLVERIRDARDWTTRFRVLDEAIVSHLAEVEAPAPEIVWAWRQLVTSGGSLPIGALAGELGWSQKRLLAGFRQEIGLPPKLFARVTRFRRVVDLVERSAEVRWAEVAQACGYYDQAHLIRDVHRFTGSAPGVFLDRHLGSRPGIAGD